MIDKNSNKYIFFLNKTATIVAGIRKYCALNVHRNKLSSVLSFCNFPRQDKCVDCKMLINSLSELRKFLIKETSMRKKNTLAAETLLSDYYNTGWLYNWTQEEAMQYLDEITEEEIEKFLEINY